MEVHDISQWMHALDQAYLRGAADQSIKDGTPNLEAFGELDTHLIGEVRGPEDAEDS